MTDFWELLDCENAEKYDEFCCVMEDDLKPKLSSLIVDRYQQYLKEKLGNEFDQQTVKDMLLYFFEDYRLTEMI